MEKEKTIFYYFLGISSLILPLLALLACTPPEIPQERHYTIGIINPNQTNTDITSGFIERMAELGYVEKKNTTFIIHTDEDNLNAAVNDLVKQKVDLIFAYTTPVAQKAKKATEKLNIPVVFVVYDPVKSGLISSLTHPGGNLTGIQIRGSAPKSLEWLLTLSPDIKNIFIPVKFDTSAAKQDLADLKETASFLGRKVITAEVTTQWELDEALAGIPADIDALFLTRSILIASNVDRIVACAIKHKIPIGSSTSMFKHGATITYGVESFHVGRQAGRFADMILRGNKPEDIPTEISDYYLGINMETAYASGIRVSNELLLKADLIIPQKNQ